MKRANGKGDVKTGWLARRLGIRVVEESEYHVVFRYPWWFPKAWVPDVGKQLAEAMEIQDRGSDLWATTRGKYVRIDRARPGQTAPFSEGERDETPYR